MICYIHDLISRCASALVLLIYSLQYPEKATRSNKTVCSNYGNTVWKTAVLKYCAVRLPVRLRAGNLTFRLFVPLEVKGRLSSSIHLQDWQAALTSSALERFICSERSSVRGGTCPSAPHRSVSSHNSARLMASARRAPWQDGRKQMLTSLAAAFVRRSAHDGFQTLPLIDAADDTPQEIIFWNFAIIIISLLCHPFLEFGIHLPWKEKREAARFLIHSSLFYIYFIHILYIINYYYYSFILALHILF